MHETTLDADARLRCEYQKHVGTVYCVADEGTIEDTNAGRVVGLAAGGL